MVARDLAAHLLLPGNMLNPCMATAMGSTLQLHPLPAVVMANLCMQVHEVPDKHKVVRRFPRLWGFEWGNISWCAPLRHGRLVCTRMLQWQGYSPASSMGACMLAGGWRSSSPGARSFGVSMCVPYHSHHLTSAEILCSLTLHEGILMPTKAALDSMLAISSGYDRGLCTGRSWQAQSVYKLPRGLRVIFLPTLAHLAPFTIAACACAGLVCALPAGRCDDQRQHHRLDRPGGRHAVRGRRVLHGGRGRQPRQRCPLWLRCAHGPDPPMRDKGHQMLLWCLKIKIRGFRLLFCVVKIRGSRGLICGEYHNLLVKSCKPLRALAKAHVNVMLTGWHMRACMRQVKNLMEAGLTRFHRAKGGGHYSLGSPAAGQVGVALACGAAPALLNHTVAVARPATD